MKVYTICCLALLLSGCAGDQRARQQVNQGDPTKKPETLAEVVPLSAELPTPRRSQPVEVESQNSNNAVQQSLTGLGLNVAKLAEKIDASLLRVSTEVDLKIQNTLKANAELEANLRAEIKNEMKATVEAILHAVAKAEVNAQAGVGNETNSTQQTVTAGRDSSSITAFTADMAKTFEKVFSMVIWIVCACAILILLIVLGMSAAVCVIMELSRRRAERRACDAHKQKTGGVYV